MSPDQRGHATSELTAIDARWRSLFCEMFHVMSKRRRIYGRGGRFCEREGPGWRQARLWCRRLLVHVRAAIRVLLEPFELAVRFLDLMTQPAPVVSPTRSHQQVGRHVVALQAAIHLDRLRQPHPRVAVAADEQCGG